MIFFPTLLRYIQYNINNQPNRMTLRAIDKFMNLNKTKIRFYDKWQDVCMTADQTRPLKS